jgi:Zn-finger protein
MIAGFEEHRAPARFMAFSPDGDLCEICWCPLQTLMKKVQAEALEAKRNSSDHV